MQIGQTVIFKLLGRPPPPSWISLDLNFVTDQTVTRAELRHHAKFCGDWSNFCPDFSILAFPPNDCSHNLGFLKFYIFNDQNGQEERTAWLRHCAKFCRNRSTTEEICQFSIFQDGGRRHLVFFEISNFQRSERSSGSNCISVPNLAKYGKCEIWRFFDFSKMAAVRHLGFVMRVWGPPTKGIWWSLSLCKIWLESMQ